MKTCSVIVPVYNASLYLAQCLSSLTHQTCRDIEIICVNDGSTDGSDAVLEAFAQADSRIRIVCQSNQGLSVARNTGMRHARGEYILMVDADDWLVPDCIETLTDEIGDNDVLCFGFRRMGDAGQILTEKVPTGPYRLTSACMRLYRRSFLQEQGLVFKPGYLYEDVLFSLNLWGSHPRMTCLDYVGYNYRLTEGSISETDHPEQRRELYREIYRTVAPLWLKVYTQVRVAAHFFKKSKVKSRK